MGVSGEIISRPGADGPLGPSLAVRENLERIAFENTLSADLAGFVALHGIEAAYSRRGALAARVAVTAVMETPIREESDDHLDFLGHVDDEARLRAVKIASFFSDVSSTRVKTSRNPLARKARLRLVANYPTGYRYMENQLRPGRFTDPTFMDAFETGYMQEADKWSLGVESSEEGLAIVKAAPRKIRGVNIGKAFTWLEDPEEKQEPSTSSRGAEAPPIIGLFTILANRGRGILLGETIKESPPAPPKLLDAQALLTEHGVVLPLLNEESVNGLTSGYKLPVSAQSLIEKTRIRRIAVLQDAALPDIFAKLMDNIVDKAVPKF